MKRFQKTDLIVVALGVLGLLGFLIYFEKAFPTASVHLSVSNTQATEIAQQYLDSQHFNLEGYKKTVIFKEDDNALYLQKTLGTDQFNHIASDLPLRYWEVRFFKELQYEEFRVKIDSQGDVIGFFHFLLETDEGQTLPQDDALLLAKNFLQHQEKISLSNYTLLNKSTKKRENRTDHYFTWETPEEKHAKAALRIDIVVHGDWIDHYNQYLKVPEDFWLAYEKERSKGGLLTSLSGIFSFLFTLSGYVFFLIVYKKTQIPWKGALVLSVAMGSTSLINIMNAIPILESGYVTESPLYAFWGEIAVKSIQSSIWLGFKTFLIGIAGWAVCKEIFKGKRQDFLSGSGDLFTLDLTKSALMGYVLAGVSFGYVTFFYLMGEHYFGVWSPPENDYSNMLSTSLPFLEPLTRAFQAAVSEELLYRFFAIAFLIKYLKRRSLALLIPAMVWGLGHSNYAVFPFYIRAIELTIDGFIWGCFFLRYGLIAVIVAHFVFDAVLMGMPLIRSSNLYFNLSGIAVIGVMFIPVILWAIAAAKNKFVLQTPVATPLNEPAVYRTRKSTMRGR